MNTLHWGWPQFVYLGLMVLGLGVGLAQDGQPKEGKHSFMTTLVATALVLWVVYCGGFFG